MAMNQQTLAPAHMGGSYGYRMDGDWVQLNSELFFGDALQNTEPSWSLQLWASSTGFEPGLLSGTKVGELAVQSLSGWSSVSATVPALPPVGSAPMHMALALVHTNTSGQAQAADMRVFAAPEIFPQPRMQGHVSCVLEDGQARLKVERIVNPREALNLSGTLALEVWWLQAPYADSAWQGTPVASAVLGCLSGGSEWLSCEYVVPASLPVASPDAAAGHLAVMLREWSPLGYVTRDVRELPASQPQVALAAEDKAPKTEAPKAEVKVEVKAEVKTEAKAPAKPEPKTEVKAVAKVEEKAPAQAEVKKGLVSVNRATRAELHSVKGLSLAVAQAIIAGRPYHMLDDVVQVKGMGPKLLAKLRPYLTL